MNKTLRRKLLVFTPLVLVLVGFWAVPTSDASRDLASDQGTSFAERARTTILEKLASIRKRGERPSKPKTSYTSKPTLLSKGWRITTGAAELARLTQEERAKAQEVVDECNREMERSTRERMTFDAEASDAKQRIYLYTITALPDRGSKFLENYKSELQAAVGEEKGQALFSMLGLGPYGSYGRYDVNIKLYPSRQTEGELDIEWVTIDPETHKVPGTSGAISESVYKYWGNLFSGE